MQIYYEFYKAIRIASKSILPKDVEFYLYELLVNPKITEQPIAILIAQSMESSSKNTILKNAADSSLLQGSIFPSKGISKDYYISMSSYAFKELNSIKNNKTFKYLAEKTSNCAKILERAAEALASPQQM